MAVATAWHIRGSYFESCNCDVICPCRRIDGVSGGRSTHGICLGVLTWLIEEGEAVGTDLAGLPVALATRYDDDEPGSPWTWILYLDERASEEQQEALEAIFTGRLGGDALTHFPWVWKASELAGVRRDVIEIVLTGSVSRGVADDVSDIEMLCVTEEQLSLEEAFELARRVGLEESDSWGDPSTPTRRVFGYLEGAPVETIWWSRELAEKLFATGGSAEAIANGVALRTSGLLARWQERLADYPDALVAERVEKAAERWGGVTPAGLLTLVRDDVAPARMEWLVESAQRVLAIAFALNRLQAPTAKRLSARVEPLAIKPERLAERIEDALAEPDPRRALLVMTELQLDAVRLAPTGPNAARARTCLAAGT